MEGLEAAVDCKDAELTALRKTLEHKEAQVCTALLRQHSVPALTTLYADMACPAAMQMQQKN